MFWMLIVVVYGNYALPAQQFFYEESCATVRDGYIGLEPRRVKAVCVEVNEADK
jgi:hypothetical protein